jgi:hypothetical protein
VSERLKKGLLGHITGVVDTHQPARQPIDARMMANGECVEGQVVAAASPHGQRLVALVARLHHARRRHRCQSTSLIDAFT